MDVQYCSLFSSDVPCSLKGFTLRAEEPRYAIGAGLSYSPFPIARNDVLCSTRHFLLSDSYDCS